MNDARTTAAAATTAAGTVYDLIIVGGGTAGMTAAIFAAMRNANVLILDAADRLGGTLWLSTGQVSAAGTRLQRKQGINDTPEAHLDDIMRISRGTADRTIAKLAVDNAAAAFDWLCEAGFQPVDGHPVMGSGHEYYSERRYYWGAEGGVTIFRTLEKALSPHIARGVVNVKLNARAESLMQDSSGRVTGVVARDASGATQRHLGRAVLLTAGGYAANGEMFRELNKRIQYARMSYYTCRGDGLTMALAAGAALQGHDKYLAGLGAILVDDNVPSVTIGRFNHWPEKRMPWEIYVNVRGERWINEDNPSVDAREHALLKQPELRFWIVLDDEILRAAPVPIDGWDRERYMAAFGKENLFYKADTIEALANKAGVDAKTLAATVTAYNAAQKGGKDALGRTHMPRPIAKPPFYAIRHQGMSISSTVGLAINPQLQVLRADGSAIAGLYAAGEVIGAGLLMGQSFCGGMLVMPAITFGKMLGERVRQLA
ncbi:MAG: FAD-dependent oxidoreductase [Rhodospirillaceae bacterium]|nr:FAD-dependent oxidoreductase [Rhodospirillaceae bacterium]